MYTMYLTRLDIAFSLSFVLGYLHIPTETLLKAVKGIIKYLKGTINYNITYCSNINNLEPYMPTIVGYSNADWGSCINTRKSISSYLFTLDSSPISQKSKKQSTVALSTTEAEFNSLQEAIREAKYIQGLLLELGFIIKPITIKTNNNRALSLAYNPEFY